MPAFDELSLIANGTAGGRSARHIGFSVAALMLAGTALVPAQGQVADLGGLTLTRNDFENFNPPGTGLTPSEITNGVLRIGPLVPQGFSGDLTDSLGTFSLIKIGASDLTLSGVNTHSGPTTVSGGRLIAGSTTALSANSRLSVAGGIATLATVDLNGFSNTVRDLQGSATGVVTSTGGPATLTVDTTINSQFSGALQGDLALVKIGAAILDLGNADIGLAPSNFTGGVTLAAGTLRVGSDLALGTGVMTVTGAASFGTTSIALRTINNDIVLQDRLTVLTPAGRQLVLNGVISGSGSLVKQGVGLSTTINGANTYTGGTTLSGGQVLVGNNSAFGTGVVTQTQTSFIAMANPAGSITLANDFVLQGTSLQVSSPDVGGIFTFSGNISGPANLVLINPLAPEFGTGGGTVVLSGNSSFTGQIRMQSDTVLGIAAGSAVSSAQAIRIQGGDRRIEILAPDQTISTRLLSLVGDGPRTVTIDQGANNLTWAGAMRDGGPGTVDTLAVVKTGTGIFTASEGTLNPFNNNIVSGGFFVTEGTLNLTGRMANAIAVSSGAALTGTGFQDVGTTTISDGATLSPGDALAAAPAIGTLTLTNLTLGATANTIFDLGVPSIDTVSPVNDLVIVTGNLDLGGTFNFNIQPGFTAGTYRLMTYGGALSGGVTLGVLPVGFNYALNAGGGNVDLEVSLIDFYWDGSGPFGNTVVDGGNGTWNGGNANWTDVGGNISIAWQNDARAFFTNVGGEVTVDGNFTYDTMFFTVDGYVLNPAAGATLGADAGTIDVTAASTATINVDLVGTNGLTKAGGGTLVLSGTNSFTGGLLIDGGTLAVTQAAALGADAVTVNGGAQTLRFDADMTVANNINGVGVGYNVDTGANTVTLEGSLSGGGADKFGSGTLVLNNAINDQPNALAVFNGSLIVNGGVQGGVGGVSASLIGGTGTITGLVSTNGTLSPGVAPGQVGTLTAGSLTLGASSTSLFDLGVVGVVGGTNDLMVVNGNLILDGTLSVNPLAGWNIGTGSFRLFNYGGALTDSGLALGGILLTPPADVTYTVNTSIANQVTLDIGYGGAFNWDGNGAPVDGIVQGGAGTWDGAGTNWTNSDGLFNLAYVDSFATVASFGGVSGGGAVDVVGTRSVGTINFTETGYVLGGAGDLLLDGGTINVSAPLATIDVAINGTNGLNKTGTGNLVLNGTSSLSGAATVAAGTLTVAGSLANAGLNLGVANGATLDGTGTIAGSVSLADGATLAINGGNAGVFTLGNLTLSGGSLLDFQLGAANTLGGPLNDRLIVTGDLVLDGLLNVTETVGGAFTLGIYNLISYGGALTNNGMDIGGALPNGLTGSVQVNSLASQVNLIVAGPNSIVLNWDGTDFTAATAGPQGGNGVWNATNTNWTGQAPGEINAAWQDNAVGIFGVAGGSVDVVDSFKFGGLGFQADGYVLNDASGSINTNGALGSFISVDGGLTATINATIGGTGPLFKQGAGTLVLGGNNTLSGNVNLANGTIAVTSNGALGLGSLITMAGTTLAAGASAGANVTLANAIVLGGGGNTNINLLGTSLMFNNDASIVTDGSALTLNGVVSGSGTLAVGNFGTLTLNGDNSYTGGTLINTRSVVYVGSDTAVGTGTVTTGGATGLYNISGATRTLANAFVLNGGTWLGGSSDLVLNGNLSGAGFVIKAGAQTLTLNNANSFTGISQLRDGRITVGTGTALGTGALRVFAPTVSPAPVAGLATTLAAGTSGLTLANAVTLDTGSNLIVESGTGVFTLAGVISGAGTLTKTQSGNLVLNGANAYTGGTSLNAGRIAVGTNSALGTGRLTMADGTTLASGAADLVLANAITTLGAGTVDSAANIFTLNGVIDGAGSLSKIGSGTLVLGGDNLYTGGTNLNVGTIQVNTNTALGTGGLVMADTTTLLAGLNNLALANGIALNGTSTVGTQGFTFTLNGVIGGTGNLAKTGTGTLVLNGANTYSGGTALNAGTIRAGNNNALGTGTLTMAAGTILQAGAPTLSVGNAIAMLDGATVDVAGQTLALGGVISGTGPLSVTDSAANLASDLTLTGINTYTGGTVVTGTQLRVSQDANLGNAAGGITLNGGTLWTTASFSSARAVTLGTGGGTARVAPGTALTLTGLVSGTSLTKIGGGELVLNGANTHAGGTTLTMGRITVGNNAALGTGALAMAGGTTLGAGANNLVLANAISTAGVGTVDTGTNTLTVDAVVSGAGSIAKTGTGNLVLNGVNTYAAGTALNAGTITVGTNAALGTGALTMSDATTLRAGVTGLTVANAITTLGAATINSGDSPSAFTLSGVISGAGSVSKTGTGLLNLTGASTYTGTTTVAAGTLNVIGSLASTVTVNTGASLTGTGTVGPLNVVAGGSVNPGVPGATNIATLAVAGPAALNGTYTAKIAASTSDLIAASGALTKGGTLVVVPLAPSSFTQFNRVYTVASGAARTGTFATIMGMDQFGAAFNPVVEYTATQANIRLAPQSLVTLGNRFGGISGNPLEVARAFDRAVAGGYNPQAFFAVYNAGSNLPRTLREMSGEQRATERRVALDTNRVFRETALDRLNLGMASMAGQQVKSDNGDSSLAIWLRGVGSWGTANTSGAATAFRTEQLGLLTGIDWARDTLTVGGMFHYTTTDVSFDVLGGSSRVETVGGTVYAGWRQQDSGFVINAGASVAGARTSGNRAVTLTGFGQSLTGRTTGTTYQVFGELAYDLVKSGNTRVEPFVRNSYVSFNASALNETGGIAALSAPKQTHNINVLNAGVRFASTLPDSKLSFNASASLQQTSGAREAATFIGIPAVGQFDKIRAVSIDPTALLVQTGIATSLSDRIRIGADYSGLFGKLNGDHGGRVTLNYAF